MLSRSLAIGVLALAACHDATSPNKGKAPTKFTFNDQQGDTLEDGGLTPDTRAIDAESVSGTISGDSLIFTVRFTSPITPNSSQAPNSVYGFFEFDVDEDPTTGYLSATDEFGGDTQLGVEYAVILYDSLFAGKRRVMLFDIAKNDGAQVESLLWIPVSYASNTITMRLPLAALSLNGGSLGFAGVIFNQERATDIVPNAGSYRAHWAGGGTASFSLSSAGGVGAPAARSSGRSALEALQLAAPRPFPATSLRWR